MILLRLISWPYLRKHLLRSLLTVAGIVLGVAVFVGMHTANQSVLYAFRRTVDRVAGATQLQVTAGEPGFPEDVLEKVQALPGIRVAVPVIEAIVQPEIPNAGALLILAVDMTGDRSLRDYSIDEGEESVIDDPLVFLAQADSIILTDAFAKQHGLGPNSKVPLRTMEGEKRFTVRGIMKSGGLTSAFGGNLAVMDVYAAQKVFGRGRRFDRIDIAVNEGLRPEDVRGRLASVLGAGFLVDAPDARGQQFESLSQIYAMTANITSLFALFIGLFLIFNTFSIAVTQRRTEIGILRALGATGAQIRTLFLAESTMLGILGSAAGIAIGIALARVFAGSVGQMLEDMYGVAQRAEEIAADPSLLATAMGLGVATSLIAAWIPARDAASVDPVKALQKGSVQVISAGENRIRRWAALAASIAAVVCVNAGQSFRPLFYAGYILTILSALLLTPMVALALAKLLRPLLRAVRPVEGTLAADSLIQAPRRTSGTVSALMLSLALVVGLAGLARASYTSILEWISAALNPDFYVTGSEKIVRRDFLLSPEVAEKIAAMEGVREVQPVRSGRVPVNGSPLMLVAVNMESVLRTSPMKAVDGDVAEMYTRAARGEGVIISDNLSLLRNLRKGDVIELPASTGPLRMPIVGVVRDYSDQQGSVFMDLSVYRRAWQDDRFSLVRVFLQPGVNSASLRQRILSEVGAGTRLFVLTNEELRSYILRLTGQWFGLTYVQIFVAVAVAILGIVNSLTVSIADRRRELGVLQAVGGLRWQIRRAIWMEALTVGGIGLVLGLALGAIQLFFSLEITRRDVAGLRLDFTYPVNIVATLLPVILGAAWIASIGPAEAAVRGSLVEALEYE